MSRHAKRKSPFKHLNTKLNVEALESRLAPTVNTVSGFVYYDANQNGLFDAGEQPIANSQIQLQDLNGNVVASTTTNAQGYYEFPVERLPTLQDATLTKTVTFGPTQTNFSLNGQLAQFDSSLGTLDSIEIRHDGSISSTIKVENESTLSESDISGTISGTLTLTGPGINTSLQPSANAGSSHLGMYDGATDFGGQSGITFPEKTASDSKTVTLTGAAMNAYIGANTVTLNESAVATSSATGGGNLDVQIRSKGLATATVIYHYKKSVLPDPKSYKVVQTVQPPTFSDGLESKSGSVIPNTIGTDFIVVGLLDHDLPNNNFGELKRASISGHVWYDANNDGVLQATEALIPGATITLTGPNGSTPKTTDANGFYEFTDLDPGTYTVKETQPTGYLDGKDNAGTKGGTVVNDPIMDQIQGITVAGGDKSENNDFGELKPASLAGHVYFDANNNGVFDPTESPIPGATVKLTGFDDKQPIGKTAITNSLGEYSFTSLRPGTYALTETQPIGYTDGKDTIGTPGGTPANDLFSDIRLAAGVDGVKNDFGELKPDVPGNPLPKVVGPLGMLPIISKNQLLNDATSNYLDPGLRGQMAFVVGTTMTLTGLQPNVAQTMVGVQMLQNGVSQQTIVNNLWNSDAHRAVQVNSVYQTVLNRAPTAAEQASGIAQLNAGTTQLALTENLFTSQDYQNLHPTSDALATALYKDILNTVPGTASTQALLQSMGNQPLNAVVHDLLTSDAALANQIDDAYRLTVRRAATAAEIATWTPGLKAGTTTLDDLTQRLLSSQEFYQLAFNNIH